MKKLTLLFGVFLLVAAVHAQEANQILDQSGIKVSYVATKLEEDKKHDKWEIKVTIDNSAAGDLVFLNSSPNMNYVKIEVPNKKGLFALGLKEFAGDGTGQLSIDGTAICRIKKGVINDSFHTNVEKGATPEVKASITRQLQPISQIQLLKVPVNELSQQRLWIVRTSGGAGSELAALQFTGWDNGQYNATFDGTQFLVSPAGNPAAAAPAPSISFLGWDHSRITASSANGTLVITRDGMGGGGQPVAQLNFLGGDGYNYSASLKQMNNNRLLPGEKIAFSQTRHAQNGAYYIILQGDGNLALLNTQNQPIWSSGTSGKPVGYFTLQEDGNLVIYSPTGIANWSSGTNGKGGAYLLVQNDGNVVLYNSNGDPIWLTNTRGH